MDEADSEAAVQQAMGDLERQTFKAETTQLLQIVSKSLYTDKEVFLRELLSNASDALEKMRYLISSGEAPSDDQDLEISISTSKKNNTITIQDSGVGMNAEELVANLGTIARSGSKNFMRELGKGEGGGAFGQTQQQMENIIGMFGVGFYSAFMVSDKIEVFSQSFKGDQSKYWVSNGVGTFSMSDAYNVKRGTKIIVHLREDCKEFSDRFRIE